MYLKSVSSNTYIHEFTLQWRNNRRGGVSNHLRLDCLLNRLSMYRSKKTSKLCVLGIWEGNPPVTAGFTSKGVSNDIFFFIWWSHHESISQPLFVCNIAIERHAISLVNMVYLWLFSLITLLKYEMQWVRQRRVTKCLRPVSIKLNLSGH